MGSELEDLKAQLMAEYLKTIEDIDDPESYMEKLAALLPQNENTKVMETPHFHKIVLKFENKSTNPNPEYQKTGDSGFDFRANLSEPVILKPLERALIPTGLYFEFQEGFEIQVRPRSGLAAKNGVTVLNTPGTVDSGYRGEIKICLINLSHDVFTVNHGDRIAQGVFSAVMGKPVVDMVEVDKVNTDTDRGTGGFGSTGKQ